MRNRNAYYKGVLYEASVYRYMGFWPDDGAPFDLITDEEGPTTTMFVETATFDDFNVMPEYDPNFPYMTSDNIDLVLEDLDVEASDLTVSLFWNADADLDLTFQCHDGVTIDASETENECLGSLDIA